MDKFTFNGLVDLTVQSGIKAETHSIEDAANAIHLLLEMGLTAKQIRLLLVAASAAENRDNLSNAARKISIGRSTLYRHLDEIDPSNAYDFIDRPSPAS